MESLQRTGAGERHTLGGKVSQLCNELPNQARWQYGHIDVTQAPQVLLGQVGIGR